jgi:hypothetical protein
VNKHKTKYAPGVVILTIATTLFFSAGLGTWLLAAVRALDQYALPTDNTTPVTLQFIGAAICFGFTVIVQTLDNPRPPAPPTAHIPYARVSEDA